MDEWLRRLYNRSAVERTLSGDLGVWPAALSEYLARLCRAYSPVDEEPPRIRLAPNTQSVAPLLGQRETRAATAVVLLSGGKDSIATGLLLQQHGWRVCAVYLTRINHSYPHEERAAQQIAALLGWEFVAVKAPPRTPRYEEQHALAVTAGESVIKNQFALTWALARLPWIPGAVACGNYLIDDTQTTSWYSDMFPAFEAFTPAIPALYGYTVTTAELADLERLQQQCGAWLPAPSAVEAVTGARYPALLTALWDVRHAVETWYNDAPHAVRMLTTSCMMPVRNKPQHRRRSLAQGVPLGEFDCGVCEKCKIRAFIISDFIGVHADETPFPPDYLIKVRKWLRATFRSSGWAHHHPSLCVSMQSLKSACDARNASAIWTPALDAPQ
jgi:7-cyano-7-deazaguanine synthase in queuosine biosynthesis